MTNPKINVVLTGATGILGSHLLYELLREKQANNSIGKIVLLARPDSNGNRSARQRILRMLTHENVPSYLLEVDLLALIGDIEIISCGLCDKSLAEKLKPYHDLANCYVIHSAACTNLRLDEEARSENYRVNYLGTLNLLDSVAPFASKFSFVSTVYSCGRKQGVIDQDYSKAQTKNFRNAYEEFKNLTERKLSQRCQKLGVDLQIFRPGVISGRLLDPPYHFASKYNVFYAYFKFFCGLKAKGIHQHISIPLNPDAALHIVPVDYVARVIFSSFTNDEISTLNIVPREGLRTGYLIAEMLRQAEYSNYSFVDCPAKAQNKTEEQYQERVASSFEAYILDEYYCFNNEELLARFPHIAIPDARTHFRDLITYAKEQKFRSVEQRIHHLVKSKVA